MLSVAIGVERCLRLSEQIQPQFLTLPDRHPVVLVAVDDEHRHLDVLGEECGEYCADCSRTPSPRTSCQSSVPSTWCSTARRG